MVLKELIRRLQEKCNQFPELVLQDVVVSVQRGKRSFSVVPLDFVISNYAEKEPHRVVLQCSIEKP